MAFWTQKRQTIGGSEIKITSIPETDLELELGWLGPDFVKKKALAHTNTLTTTSDLKARQKFFLEPKLKAADIENFYQNNAAWERQTQARFFIMSVMFVTLIIAYVCSAVKRGAVNDWDFLAVCVISFVLCTSTRLRNSRIVWHVVQVVMTLIIMTNLAMTISVAFFHPNIYAKIHGVDQEDTIDRMRRILRVPLLTFTLIPVFAASGLPNKFVVINGALQMIACCVDNFIFLNHLFPNHHLQIFPISILLALVGAITLYTVHDHDKHKKAAFLHRVLAEQSNLGKLCEQEAAGTHQRRIVDYLCDAVCSPLTEAHKNIKDNTKDPQTVVAFVALQIRAAIEVLHDAVSVTKLESGGFEFHHRAFLFSDMLNTALDLAKRNTGSQIVPAIDNSLMSLVVRGDPNHLTSVFTTTLLISCRSSEENQQVTFTVTPLKWNLTQQSQFSSPTVLIKFVIEFQSSLTSGDPSSLLKPWHQSKASLAGLKLVLGKGVVEKGHRGKFTAEAVGQKTQLCVEIEFPLCSQGDLESSHTP